MKQNQFKKRRITPLALLSQVKKSSNLSSSIKDAEFNLVQFKHSSKRKPRYSESEFEEKPPQPSKRYLNKIEEIAKTSSRKSSKNLRFHSMQKERSAGVGSSLSKLPTSTHKKRLNTQHHVVQDDIVSKIRNRIEKCKTETKKPQPSSKRVLMDQLRQLEKIFKHFQNLWAVIKLLKKKKKEQQFIQVIKNYVLDDEGDISHLENVYACPQAQKIIRKLLFYERLIIILSIDLTINCKLRLAESTIKLIFDTFLQFYGSIYHDIKSHPSTEKVSINLDKQIKRYFDELDIRQKKSFDWYKEWMNAKIKSVIKFSKSVDNFFKFHYKNVAEYSSNLTYFKLLEFYAFSLLGCDWSDWNIDFLQTCPSPYLHIQPQKKLTLILDLDQTLIHYKVSNSYQGQFLIRPYLFEFLSDLQPYFQIGIFTCSLPEYADIIINHMNHISFRLYRHHTIRIKGQYVKDLSRVGRDLDRVIMVDNIQSNYRLQKSNGILIKSWYGDKKDAMLRHLAKQMVELAKKQPVDVRAQQFPRQFV